MSKILVAYFSAEGHTAKVARCIAKLTDADIFEIKPAVPYTSGDIKWLNPLSRCNKEYFGKKEVPIEAEISGFEEYELVYIGFPIWYYGAPNIISTFIKQYDWSGKKIALFATSGGSDISKVAVKLEPLLDGNGEIVDSLLVKPSDSRETVKNWTDSVAKSAEE